jgi:hypothetical protein
MTTEERRFIKMTTLDRTISNKHMDETRIMEVSITKVLITQHTTSNSL